jgi:hypothetical protein
MNKNSLVFWAIAATVGILVVIAAVLVWLRGAKKG